MHFNVEVNESSILKLQQFCRLIKHERRRANGAKGSRKEMFPVRLYGLRRFRWGYLPRLQFDFLEVPELWLHSHRADTTEYLSRVQ
jgi:hypothetical protein